MPEVGERRLFDVQQVEWDGQEWMVVCPNDDVALARRDGELWPLCPVCGRRWPLLRHAAADELRGC